MHGNFKYTPAIAQYICNQLMIGRNLGDICEDDGMPSRGAVNNWLLCFPDFAKDYAHAREVQGDVMAENVITAIKKTETKEFAPDQARVIIGGLQWAAARLRPKVYGDKMTLAGDADNPLALLAVRLDQAIAKQDDALMIDVTPINDPLDASDLV